MQKLAETFDEKATEQTPEWITLLQERLNEFNALKSSEEKPKPLDVNGELDEATQAAWLSFKKETFADSSLSIGFLKDKTGMGFTNEELVKLGVDPKALGEKGKKPEKPESYDRENPPKAVIKAVQEKLQEAQKKEGIEPEHQIKITGKMDDKTKAVVLYQKKETWIDGRLSVGALNDLDDNVTALQAALKLKQEKDAKKKDTEAGDVGEDAPEEGKQAPPAKKQKPRGM